MLNLVLGKVDKEDVVEEEWKGDKHVPMLMEEPVFILTIIMLVVVQVDLAEMVEMDKVGVVVV